MNNSIDINRSLSAQLDRRPGLILCHIAALALMVLMFPCLSGAGSAQRSDTFLGRWRVDMAAITDNRGQTLAQYERTLSPAKRRSFEPFVAPVRDSSIIFYADHTCRLLSCRTNHTGTRVLRGTYVIVSVPAKGWKTRKLSYVHGSLSTELQGRTFRFVRDKRKRP